jgi:hypothetical protein
MDAMQAPPRLPGTSATGLELLTVMISGPVFAFGSVMVMAAALFTGTVPRGHLPWPLVQWALTTPVGVLGLIAAGALFIALPLVAFQWQMWPSRSPARAIDITGLPPWFWPKRPPVRPGETRVERWLGQGRRAQRVSLAMLGGAVLLGLLLVGVLLAPLAWGLIQFFAPFAVGLIRFLSHECGAHGCLPQTPLYPYQPAYPQPYPYPVVSLAVGSEIAAIVVVRLANYRWLRRAEASSGVWLRYRDILWAAPLYYVRRPGVTPEAAAAAVTRFGPAGEAPLARTFAIFVLAMTPLVLLLSASIFLQGWLQFQWILR